MLAIYAPVEKAESRLVAGAMIVLVTALGALSTRPRALTYALALAVLVLAILAVARPLAGSTTREQSRLWWMNATQARLAQRLRTVGVCRDADVAVIGSPYNAYWAHADGLHVVASPKISLADRFWSLPGIAKTRALGALSDGGRRAVVADPPPAGTATDGWEQIAGTGYLIRRPASRRMSGRMRCVR
jgi:hypothetical protein